MKKKRYARLMQNVTLFSLLSLSCLSIPSVSVHAEGAQGFDGAEGVNRVVRSESGSFTTVGGTGTMNFINVPPDGGYYTDKPSFYVGTTIGQDEVDAGLQYEPETIPPIAPAGRHSSPSRSTVHRQCIVIQMCFGRVMVKLLRGGEERYQSQTNQ